MRVRRTSDEFCWEFLSHPRFFHGTRIFLKTILHVYNWSHLSSNQCFTTTLTWNSILSLVFHIFWTSFFLNAGTKICGYQNVWRIFFSFSKVPAFRTRIFLKTIVHIYNWSDLGCNANFTTILMWNVSYV